MTQYVSDKIDALRVNPGSVDPDNPDVAPVGSAIVSTEPPAEPTTTNADDSERPAKKVKVADETRIALQPPQGYSYGNVSVLRGNAMKFLPNFFEKAQVSTRDR